ncbi:sensor histidine kinase [Micromonospora avicenniae]|uniref:sensor histidine kinase n=1 Tax=Micromonospora avicenniae TaxID=1198245 RepID=UPI00331975CB
MRKPLSPRQWAFDILIAALASVVAIAQLVVPNIDGTFAGPLWLNLVIGLMITVPLAVRRIWPGTVAAVGFGAHALPSLFLAHSATFWGTLLPMAVAMYSAGRWSRSRWARLAPLLPVITFSLYPIHTADFRDWEAIVFPLVWHWFAWGAGYGISRLAQQRHDLHDALRQLAEQRDAHSRHVVLEERARIAREMHDVVAHGVTVMVIQAGAARMELDGAASEARDSLLAVEATGRQVLGELRRTVNLLRSGDDLAPAGQPSPGLADLPELVKSMRTAGLQVNLKLPEQIKVDQGRELAVYRIVQEALTNSLRHAGRTRVDVRITAGPDLQVEVSDQGSRRNGHGSGLGGGHGLIGMRERVGMYGGRLRAEPSETGFVVHAAIPTEGL